ncbi:hypothetical protein N9Q58_04165 [Polaribacter sp.]|nr:hypothetical protein [Polaribacter sp.]
MNKLTGLLIIGFLFFSCIDDDFNAQTDTLKIDAAKIDKNKTNLTTEEVKAYFLSKGFDVSPVKSGNNSKNGLKFRTIKEYEDFLVAAEEYNEQNKKYEEMNKQSITQVDNESGGDDSNDIPNFIIFSSRQYSSLGTLNLKLGFVLDTDTCEPSGLTSWVDGNLHIGNYTQMMQYLERAETDDGSPYIHYGVVGTISYTVNMGGTDVLKTDTVQMNGLHTCR